MHIWRKQAEDYAIKHDHPFPDEFIQDQIFDWLDSSSDSTDVPAIAILLGQLVQHDLFSYAMYIQRLISRGETGLSFAEVRHIFCICTVTSYGPTQTPGSHHRDFLRSIPLINAPASLINQRKVALYGARTREAPEDHNERQLRKEIRSILHEVFASTSLRYVIWKAPSYYFALDADLVTQTAAVNLQCPDLAAASHYEQVRTLRQWLLPILQKHIRRYAPVSL